MRITFILPVASMGGGTRVVAIYAQRLMRLGHCVRVISVPQPAPPLRDKVKTLVTQGRWLGAPSPLRSHLDGCGVEHRILERCRPVTDDDVPDADVVIATWWETAEWVAALSPSKGAKVYFIQHHEIFPYLPVERCRATYRLPLHKIVIARWLKELMSNEYSDDDVDLVPNSVDRDLFFAPPRGKQTLPTVGFLYATAAFKGMDRTLAALQAVHEKVPMLRLISFGTETAGPGVTLPEHCNFVFSPAQDEIRNLYAHCDVWVTASSSEGFNLPAMEAMACRTPVVATRTGWPAEAVVSGTNGVLVDIDDVEGLAKGVEWVISRNENEWLNMSQNALTTASSGSWDDSARMFERSLIKACEKSFFPTTPAPTHTA